MKSLFTLLGFLFLLSVANAQDEAIFTHYYLSPILVNPSYAGFEENHQIQFNARAQWSSFPDAPKTLGVQYHGPIGKTFGLGVGVITESAGKMTRLRARLNYAFRFTIQKDIKFATGFSTEFQQMSVGNAVTGENFYQPGDDVVEGFIDGRRVLDASFGLYGMFRDRTWAGISFTNLVRARLDDIVTEDDEAGFLDYYVIMAGHRFDFADGLFHLEPSVMLREIRDSPFQADFNLKGGFLYDQTNAIIAGLSYRSLGAFGVLVGAEINTFRLYYGYDFSTQDFSNYAGGAHEVTIGFGFQNNKNRKPIPIQ